MQSVPGYSPGSTCSHSPFIQPKQQPQCLAGSESLPRTLWYTPGSASSTMTYSQTPRPHHQQSTKLNTHSDRLSRAQSVLQYGDSFEYKLLCCHDDSKLIDIPSRYLLLMHREVVYIYLIANLRVSMYSVIVGRQVDMTCKNLKHTFSLENFNSPHKKHLQSGGSLNHQHH